MAKAVKKISDKLAKVGDNFSVNMYDNGFVFEISGKDSSDDWKTARILCSGMDEVVELFKEAVAMPRNE